MGASGCPFFDTKYRLRYCRLSPAHSLGYTPLRGRPPRRNVRRRMQTDRLSRALNRCSTPTVHYFSPDIQTFRCASHPRLCSRTICQHFQHPATARKKWHHFFCSRKLLPKARLKGRKRTRNVARRTVPKVRTLPENWKASLVVVTKNSRTCPIG